MTKDLPLLSVRKSGALSLGEGSRRALSTPGYPSQSCMSGRKLGRCLGAFVTLMARRELVEAPSRRLILWSFLLFSPQVTGALTVDTHTSTHGEKSLLSAHNSSIQALQSSEFG